MKQKQIEYAILVRAESRLEKLRKVYNNVAQAKFAVSRKGGKFEEYEEEHDHLQDSLGRVQQELSRIVKNKIVERPFLPSFIFADNQVVVVVGQDGLVANTAKYASSQPIVAVNPDPETYDGVLLPFTPQDFAPAVENVIRGKHREKLASFAEAVLNDGQRLLAFNDLFIGAASHVSARYKISFGGKSEVHSSSGIIVSTMAGATGWMSSILGMYEYMQQQKSGKKSSWKEKKVIPDNELMFAVREAFASKQTQTGILLGNVRDQQPLIVESLMANNGVIFSDGIEADFLQFNSGTIARIGVAREKAHLVVS